MIQRLTLILLARQFDNALCVIGLEDVIGFHCCIYIAITSGDLVEKSHRQGASVCSQMPTISIKHIRTISAKHIQLQFTFN